MKDKVPKGSLECGSDDVAQEVELWKKEDGTKDDNGRQDESDTE